VLKRVVFLDRDGVINRDSPNYIKSWAEFEFLPSSLEAIARLTRHGATCIVITNQSAVNRGLISRSRLEEMHQRMQTAIHAAGGVITDIFYCPHTPEEGCECRKPKPGLIHQACRAYPIDLSVAVMVGDSARDIECGRRAGCGRTLLITGSKAASAPPKDQAADFEAANLGQGVEWILGNPNEKQIKPVRGIF